MSTASRGTAEGVAPGITSLHDDGSGEVKTTDRSEGIFALDLKSRHRGNKGGASWAKFLLQGEEKS